MFYVGTDGCKAGWFAVRLGEGGDWEINLFPNIGKLWEQYKDARLVLLDIPIGLLDEGHNKRSCDEEAKKLLGAKRGTSVFPTPCRRAVYSDNYDEARKINRDETDRGLSIQAWCIVPKIKQVDQLLLHDITARSRIREVHPEVCFWALNHGKPMQHSKTKEREQAFLERMQVLISVYPYTQNIVDYAASEYSRKEVGKDDILDALVAAVTASAKVGELCSLPKMAERDSRGLPMEMVYRLPAK